MVDIHCHILPGLDDGAADMEEALLMARQAFQKESRTVIATPHAGHREWKCSPEEIRASAAMLQQTARQRGIDLTVLPGMELLCTSRLEELLEEKRYLTLADSRYLLVEFYFDELLRDMDAMLERIASCGLVPMIAHPERYNAVQRDPRAVAMWMEQGFGIQINAGSLLGHLGREAKMTGKWLVHNGLAHVVASDGHDLERRSPQLSSVRDYLEERVSIDCAQTLLEANPLRIQMDLPLPGLG